MSQHSREGSRLSEESMLGAEMLLNDDYKKRHPKYSDNMSEVSIPLSKKSHHSHQSHHSNKSHNSHRSKASYGSRHSSHQSPKFAAVYDNNNIYNDDSSSSNISDLIGSFREGSYKSEKSVRSRRSHPSKSSSSSGSSTRPGSGSSSSGSSYSRSSGSTSSSSVIISKKKKMSQEDILRKKQELLFELDRFEMKGRSYFRKLTLASSLEEIEGAHERIQLDMELDDAIASFRKLLISIVSICERVCDNYFFQKYSPIKPRLTGWSQSVSLEIESYDNVFKKLYIKHRSKTLVGPEVQLIGMIGMSAITFHITSLAANKFPGVSDMLNKDPALFHKFVQFINSPINSAMNSMGTDSQQQAQRQSMPMPNPSMGSNGGSGVGNTGNSGGSGGGFSDLLNMGMSYLGSMMKPNIPVTPTQNQNNGNNGNNVGQSPKMPMPMPMPSRPPMNETGMNPKPQMKGPSNVEDILKAIEENRLESASNVSDTEFSEIPDDVSISGVVSKKPRRIIKAKK